MQLKMTKRQAQMAAKAMLKSVEYDYRMAAPTSRHRDRVDEARLLQRGRALCKYVDSVTCTQD